MASRILSTLTFKWRRIIPASGGSGSRNWGSGTPVQGEKVKTHNSCKIIVYSML